MNNIGKEFVKAKKVFGNDFTYYKKPSITISGMKKNKKQTKQTKPEKQAKQKQQNPTPVRKKKNKLLESIQNLRKTNEKKAPVGNDILKKSTLILGGILLGVAALFGAIKYLKDGGSEGDGTPDEYSGEYGYYDENDPKEGKKNRIKNKIIAECLRVGLPPEIGLAVCEQESNFNPKALNPKSKAAGLFQIMPENQKSYGIASFPFDEDHNIRVGINMLKKKYDKYGGNLDKVLWDYNGGVVAVQNNNVSPEARQYAEEVKVKIDKYKEEQSSLANRPTSFKGHKIKDYYGYRKVHPVTGEKNVFHNGIDLAYNLNDPVKAFVGGIVVKIGQDDIKGKYIKIQDDWGHIHCYLHLNSVSPNLRERSKVSKDEEIGKAGSTGRSTGPHLHYTIYKPGGKETINPLFYYPGMTSQKIPALEFFSDSVTRVATNIQKSNLQQVNLTPNDQIFEDPNLNLESEIRTSNIVPYEVTEIPENNFTSKNENEIAYLSLPSNIPSHKATLLNGKNTKTWA